MHEWAKVANHEDVRTAQSVRAVFDGAERLITATDGNLPKLLEMENSMCLNPNEFSTMSHLIIKAAISRVRIISIDKPTHLELVVPMYHEKIRISPRESSTEPLLDNSFEPDINGEDALIRKYLEMKWLTNGSQVDYRLVFVDDMCDQESGKYAKQLIVKNSLPNCDVYFLGEAIDTVEPGSLQEQAIKTIIDGRESIRGGALCLGFAEAVLNIKHLEREKDSIIGYVDADSSYSLTQVGIPLWEMIHSPLVKAVTASRQHILTYMEPQKAESQTSHRSSGLIRLKQVVGYLRKTILEKEVPADTQSGFKLLRPEVLETTLRQPNKAHNFSYDTQLLSRIARLYPGTGTIKTFGVVCVDSDELSTANNGVTYFAALKIIQTIAEEVNLNQDGAEMWLLNFLTRDLTNYKMVIRLLDDNTDITQWFPVGTELYNLVFGLRHQIQTDRDTTAVGGYFTPDICYGLARVLRAI